MADNPFMDAPMAPQETEEVEQTTPTNNPFLDAPMAPGTSASDRGRTLIGDTGLAPVDYVTEKLGQLGYAVADNIIGFDDGVDTTGEKLGSAVGNIAEGIGAGAVGAVEGVGTTLALVPDVAFGTEYGDKITRGAESLKEALDLTPEGFLGKGAEIVTQFVVPGGLAAKGVSIAAKTARAKKGLANVPLTRGQKFGLAAKELAAAGAVDAAVSTDGMSTIGDWAETGYTQTEDLIGLSGREKALARFRNKLRLGVESTLLGGVAQGALMAGGKTIGGVAKVPKVQASARAVKQKLDDTGAAIDQLLYQRLTAPDELSTLKRGVANVIAYGKPGGYLPRMSAEERLAIDAKVGKEVGKAERILKEFETEIDAVLPKLPDGEESGNLARAGMLSKVEEYLTQADPKIKTQILQELPEGVRSSAVQMRSHIDELSNRMIGSEFLKNRNFTTKDGRTIKDVIDQNINSYLRRRYRIHEDAKYTPTEESIAAADDFFKANRRATEKELTRLARRDVNQMELSDDFLKANGLKTAGSGKDMKVELGTKVTDAVAKKAREAFLRRHSIKTRQPFEGGRIARDKLDTGMLVSRENIPRTLRALMGEVGTTVKKSDKGYKIYSDPREAYLSTAADISQFSAVDDFFSSLSNLSNRQDGLLKNMIIKGEGLSPDQRKELVERGYVQLGGDSSTGIGAMSTPTVKGRAADKDEILAGTSGWGSLNDHYVPRPLYNNLTNYIIGEEETGVQALRSTWQWLLRAKGVTQYSKTILSPITQIRNFTTASAFALANGNIPIVGRGGSLSDSLQIVKSNLLNKGEDAFIDELMDAQRRGMIGTNAELREIQDSLRKGVGLEAREPKTAAEALVGEKVAKAASGYMKPLEDVYQASDDFWKLFNYQAEQAHIRKALEGASLRQKVNYLTKNGEDMTPEIQQMLKQGDVDMDELIKNRAAQIVRDTVPNYNKGATDLVKFGRKLPLGNFITFPAEIYRTGFGIVKQSLDDMASDIPAVQARGRNRLVGFMGTTMVAPVAALEFGYALSGVKPEEMDAYKRSFAAPWEKGAVLIPLGKDEDGKIQYMNFSTSNPYDQLYRFANRAVNEYDDAMRKGEGPVNTFGKSVTNAVREIFEPFLSEAMLTEAVVDVVARGGKTNTGASVYNSEDPWPTKGAKMITHVLNTMVPNVSPIDLDGEPGRFIRGTVGNIAPGIVSPKDNQLRERDFATEIIRAFGGLSLQEFNPEKGLEYAAFGMSEGRTNAKRMFNQIVDDGNATSSSLANAFQKANNAKLNVDRRFYQLFEDLKAMGISEREMFGILKREGVSGYKEVLDGKFVPFKVTRKNIRDMRTAGIFDQYPQEEIQRIQREMSGISLIPDDSVQTERPPATNPFMSAPKAPSSNPFMSAPQSNSNLQPSNFQPTIQQTQVDPRLIPDPRTQELLNR